MLVSVRTGTITFISTRHGMKVNWRPSPRKDDGCISCPCCLYSHQTDCIQTFRVQETFESRDLSPIGQYPGRRIRSFSFQSHLGLNIDSTKDFRRNKIPFEARVPISLKTSELSPRATTIPQGKGLQGQMIPQFHLQKVRSAFHVWRTSTRIESGHSRSPIGFDPCSLPELRSWT